MKKVFLVLYFMYMMQANAKESMPVELSASIGLVNVSYSESESKLAGMTNISEAQSGRVSALSANFNYKIFPSYNSSWFLSGIVPFLSSSGDAFFSLGGGYEYYFSTLGNKTIVEDSGTSLKMSPKFHFFVGGELDIGYLVYTTEEAQKTDVLFEIGFTGGAVYAWKKDWAIRSQLSVAKGVGVATSTIGIKVFIGGTYYLED